jgi:hypothetical protein
MIAAPTCLRIFSKWAVRGAISTGQWIGAVGPRWASIPVGTRDTFGHRRLEVLRRFPAGKGRDLVRGYEWSGEVLLDGSSVSPELACLR